MITEKEIQDFIDLIEEINDKEDSLSMERLSCLRHPERIPIMTQFIKDNDININHLHDNECDLETYLLAHDKFEQISYFAAALDNYGLDEE